MIVSEKQCDYQFVVVDGLNLRRGAIAALATSQLRPSLPIFGVAFKSIHPWARATRITMATNYNDYSDAIEGLLRDEGPALIVPATKAAQKLAKQFRPRHTVITESYLQDDAGFDKLALRERFPSLRPWLMPFYAHGEQPLRFPLRAKPRDGQGSKGQLNICTEEQMTLLDDPNKYYFEPLFGDTVEEYSLTIVRTAKRRSWMCIRRLLQHDGITVKASRHVSTRIAKQVEEIAMSVECDSLINLQFAAMPDGIRVYDINPRFGHSEIFRMCFGFNFIAEFCGSKCAPLTDRCELTLSEAYQLIATTLNTSVRSPIRYSA